MDCSICCSMPLILRPPRNTICGACYEGAKSVITLMNKLESDERADKATNSLPSSPNPCKASSAFLLPSWFLYLLIGLYIYICSRHMQLAIYNQWLKVSISTTYRKNTKITDLRCISRSWLQFLQLYNCSLLSLCLWLKQLQAVSLKGEHAFFVVSFLMHLSFCFSLDLFWLNDTSVFDVIRWRPIS